MNMVIFCLSAMAICGVLWVAIIFIIRYFEKVQKLLYFHYYNMSSELERIIGRLTLTNVREKFEFCNKKYEKIPKIFLNHETKQYKLKVGLFLEYCEFTVELAENCDDDADISTLKYYYSNLLEQEKKFISNNLYDSVSSSITKNKDVLRNRICTKTYL